MTLILLIFLIIVNGIGEGDSEEANAPFDKQLFQDDIDDVDNELRKCQLKGESTASN